MEGAGCLDSSFRLGVAVHIEGDASADLGLGAYAVDGLLHFAMATEAAFYGVGSRGQQGVIQKRQRLVEVLGEQLLERLADVFESAHAATQADEFLQGGVGSTAAIKESIDFVHDVAQRPEMR